MTDILLLLSPRWKRLRNRIRISNGERRRLPLIIGLVVILWAVIYLVFVKALIYFSSEEMFGTIAATKLMSMILVTFAFVALISNIITTFSTYYLSQDLELVMASPIPAPSLYTARFIETLGESSWMMLLFGFPVFLAYGKVFSCPWTFYAVSLVGFLSLVAIITALGVLLVQSLVRTFPVRRLRDLFVLIGILIFIGIYLLFRMVRPEEFLNPEGFASVMDYLSIMSETSSPFLPTSWLLEAIRPYITGHGHDQILFYMGLLVSAAIATFRLAGHNHEAVHAQGYSRSVESRGARLSKSRFMALLGRVLHRFLDRPTAALVMKETKLMIRDWGRLSQLLLLLALIVVYLYNFSVLPSLENPAATMMLKSTIAFLNIGLAGFVLSSLGVRFLFPALSSEGRAFWILKGSPVELRRILWVKFLFYLVPMLVLGLFLVIATNRLLGLGILMSVVSTVTVVFITVGITSLSIGMGVLYADFKETDPNRVFSGIGGLLTMIYGGIGVASVILMEAFPVYRIVTMSYFQHPLVPRDYVLMGICFLGAAGAALFLIVYPMRAGFRKIAELQI